ncbi:hypothetical protein LPJ66_002031 [Kickxella alabastrina]|uniref:Uncharacterized protein n=1 Tax=Kickxella alabastrina TaxID=61397 RepID=A0ACC1IRI2_9FUNG|nr:hypothetical protein LPJ66_002031 [Kickxella alabastrina]
MESPEELPHGILGHWAVVCHGFNIASIAGSVFVIISVIWGCVRRPVLYKLTTFRLSAWIALCDIIYSACQLCTYDNYYMVFLSETQLRVIYWLMSASTLSFAFLSGCIGLQMILTVVFKKGHHHHRIEPWYGCVSLFLGFLITHPIMYIYKLVQWRYDMQVFHVYDNPKYFNIASWVTMWAWMFATCAFLFVTAALVWWTLATVNKEKMGCMVLPEGESSWYKSPAAQMSIGQRKWQRLIIIRIMLYPLVPIVTQTWVLCANMTPVCPMWLYVIANIMPATQGMLNLLIFLGNPALDKSRRRIVDKLNMSIGRRKHISLCSISSTVNDTRVRSISSFTNTDDKSATHLLV